MKAPPIYLKDVESNPKPGPYLDLLNATKAKGIEPWPIWHLFNYRPEDTIHLARFTQGIMHTEAPIEPKLRELIAAYTSYLNKCDFCMKSHAAVAGAMYNDHDFVMSVLNDMEKSALPEKEKALLRYVQKITLNLPDTGESDIQALKKIGWDDGSLYFVIAACALFNFYNRWITANGVKPLSDENHKTVGKNLALGGYDPSTRVKVLKGTSS